ncbi:M43 family zinc metalloprotease [Aquimarina spinulae]|uniref:M43 family zinc metalloprotease n=1 Tax=Aquimarina spinulae TaxID=1192023 RepID=UPI000D55427F|nr:M43 family zinc metalloprotease [Aquimarina spinulae]
MKHKLQTVISFILFCMLVSFSHAQNRCGTKLSPEEEVNFKKTISKVKTFKKTGVQSKSAATPYVIPVVFHILHNGGGSVSKADMKCRIDDVFKTINGDYNGTFPGFNQIDPRFESIKDKMNIEFIPASVDPDGNAMDTPGMDWQANANIAYGYDPNIYKYMWWGKKNKYYLDVVVVDAPNEKGGTNGSGHAFLPIQDVIPHVTYNWRYVGSTCGSQSAPGFEKVMTHEFGHYFGLRHTFYESCDVTNDGIDDTPPTTQAEGCERDKLNNCGVYANLENHMDYNTSCQNMFTKGQVSAMTYWLEDSTEALYSRRLLWQDSNLSSVGILKRTPIADFASDYTAVCNGASITFEDLSLGLPTSWQWQFEGGSPSTSAEKNPVIRYDNSGIYKVRLIASNDSGQNTEEKTSYIYINQKTSSGLSENFQGQFPPTEWDIINPDKGFGWEKRSDAGNGDSSSIIMNNSDNAIVGEEDFLRLPYYDFSSAKNSQMYFDLAYTKFDDASPDKLKVQVSKDCGNSWTDVYSKTHTELETKSVTTGLSNGWTPKQESDWRKEVIDLSAYDGESEVTIRFMNISGYGTRIWIDNINILINNDTTPVSDFYSNKRVSNCNSTEISFKDVSVGNPTSWNWTFEGATPSSSTDKNPKVTYNNPGSYNVSLTTSNANGTGNTVAKNAYITVTNPTKNSFTEGFEGSFPPSGWEIIDNDGELAWEKSNAAGRNSSSCMIMNNTDNEEIGEIDEIILNPIDMSGGETTFSFDLAYTKFDNDSKDKLRILVSTNCGSSWTEVYSKTHTELETVATTDDPDTWINEINLWVPTQDSHWRTENVSLSQFSGKENVLIKLENTSGYGTRIWIDNLKFDIENSSGNNLSAPTGLVASNVSETSLTLSWDPAPSNEQVVGYDIYQDNAIATSVTGTSANITGLTANTAYQYKIKAKDASGNTSEFSNIVNVTTSSEPSPTCTDGIQNGDETGIDCGGSCEPCNPSSYCSSNGSNPNDEYISRIQLGNIDKTSTAGNGGYSDFTSESTPLPKGVAQTITITPTWSSTVYSEGYSVWIDYNQDGDFEDSGEQVFSKSPSKDTSIKGEFTVPGGAKNGNTRMRVSMAYNKIPDTCETFDYGEVEDYTVSIEGATSNPTCTDGIQNGDETGVDCGGSSCSPCNNTDGIVYVDIEDLTVTSSNTWEFFRIEVGDNRDYGAWYTSNSVRLVTYDKDIVCQGNEGNITLIGEGEGIDGSDNFIAKSNSYTISSSSYTTWNGKSGFIGFTFKINGNTHYGWFHISVASNGLSYTILDYAYNKKPNEIIYTRSSNAINSIANKGISENKTFTSPNPFTNTFVINTSKLDKTNITVKVFDIHGKLLIQEEYTKNPRSIILGSELKMSGIYFVQVQTNSKMETLRILKY